VRQGNVERVDFFDNDEMLEDRSQFQPVEGPCLVLFKDGRVGQAYVPRYDVRIPCARARPTPITCAYPFCSHAHRALCATPFGSPAPGSSWAGPQRPPVAMQWSLAEVVLRIAL
jgi:hypothetical protein